MSNKTYKTKEMSEIFNISPPRLLQFRKGQKVKTTGKKTNREYEFNPILQEGKDWYWNESEVVYTKSAVTKLQNRKIYRKHNDSDEKQIRKVKSSRKVKHDHLKKGEYTVPTIASEVGITVQKIYALRDKSTNKPIAYTNYLIENKDWKYIDGKVILLESAKQKIQDYVDILKEKQEIPKPKRITVLLGNKVFNLNGEEAKIVINMIKQKHKK